MGQAGVLARHPCFANRWLTWVLGYAYDAREVFSAVKTRYVFAEFILCNFILCQLR